MIGKVNPGLLHQGIESIFWFTKEDKIVRKKDGTDVGGGKVYAKTWGVELNAKIIYEDAEENRGKIATCKIVS